jgi:hypothetical protein
MLFDEKEYFLKALRGGELEAVLSEIRAMAERQEDATLVIKRKRRKMTTLEHSSSLGFIN